MFQSREQIVFACKTAQHHACKRYAVLGVDIAEGSSVVVGLERYAFEHIVHIYLHKADNEGLITERQLVHRDSDNDLLLVSFRVFQGDRRLGKRGMIEVIQVYIVHSPERRVYKPVRVYKRELFEGIKLLHSRLICLQMLNVAEVVCGKKSDGGLHIPDIALKGGGYDLFASARKLVKVEKADGVDCVFGVCLCLLSRPECACYQYRSDYQAADYRDRYGFYITVYIHTMTLRCRKTIYQACFLL